MTNPANRPLNAETNSGEHIAKEIESKTRGDNASHLFSREVSELQRRDHGHLNTYDSNSLILAAQDLNAKGILPNLTLSENEINKAAGLPKLAPGERETPLV